MGQIQIQTPIGALQIQWNELEQIQAIRWGVETKALKSSLPIPFVVAELIDRFRGYFSDGLPLGGVPWQHIDQSTWTPFQRDVYFAIAHIPHGETRTYGWVAARIGKVMSSRAVGQALRNNPIPILIPCHRVTSASHIGGFMGAADPNDPALQLKVKLLGLEDQYRNPLFSFLSELSVSA